MLKTVLPRPHEFTTEDTDRPVPQEGEVLLKVEAVTLCGSDVRVWNGQKTGNVHWPATIGHEVAGEVAALGDGVRDFTVGQKVSLAPWFTCGRCRNCVRDQSNLCDDMKVFGYQISGGLAEYTVVPADGIRNGQLVANSGALSAEVRALAEPLACVYHGHVRSRITDASSVLIMGGGPIGLLHLKLAVMAGAQTVIVSEPSEFRRSVARNNGAHITIDPTTSDLATLVSDATDGAGVDVTLVCIGFGDLVNDAIELTAKGGVINLFAGFGGDGSANVDLNGIHYKQLDVIGNSGATLADYTTAVDLLESGRVDLSDFVTDTFPLDVADRALETAISGEAIKVAVVTE